MTLHTTAGNKKEVVSRKYRKSRKAYHNQTNNIPTRCHFNSVLLAYFWQPFLRSDSHLTIVSLRERERKREKERGQRHGGRSGTCTVVATLLPG